MTKRELIDLLQNSRAVPDEAEVVYYRAGMEGPAILREDGLLFLIDQHGLGCPGGLD